MDRTSLLAHLLTGSTPQTNRLADLVSSDPAQAMLFGLPPQATPDTRAGRPDRGVGMGVPSGPIDPVTQMVPGRSDLGLSTASRDAEYMKWANLLAGMVGSMNVPRRLFHVVGDAWQPGTPLQSLYRQMGPDAYDEFARRWPDAHALVQDHPHKIFFYDSPTAAREHARAFGGKVVKVDPSYVELVFDQLEQPGFWATQYDVPAEALRPLRTKP